MPLGDEPKWLLKMGGGCIFESCDISRENMSTPCTVSLSLFMYVYVVSLQCLLMPIVSAFICWFCLLHSTASLVFLA